MNSQQLVTKGKRMPSIEIPPRPPTKQQTLSRGKVGSYFSREKKLLRPVTRELKITAEMQIRRNATRQNV